MNLMLEIIEKQQNNQIDVLQKQFPDIKKCDIEFIFLTGRYFQSFTDLIKIYEKYH
jgi:hypothetical protein